MLSNTKESVTNDLKREIETMALFDSPYIVKLLGITDSMSLVFATPIIDCQATGNHR